MRGVSTFSFYDGFGDAVGQRSGGGVYVGSFIG